MPGLIADLLDPRWWVSVVIAGVLVNVAAEYLKPWLDGVMGRVSSSRALAVRKRRDQREAEVARLLAEPTAVTDLKIDVLHANPRALLYMVAGVFVSQLATSSSTLLLPILGLLVMAYVLVRAIEYASKSARAEALLRQVEKRREARKDEGNKDA